MSSSFYFFNKFSGVQLMTAALISIAVQSFLANVSIAAPMHITRAIIILSNIYIFVTWIIIIIGRSVENVNTLRFGLILWSAFICFWIGSVSFSIMSTVGEKHFCAHRRCPESMWLFNSSWHCDWSLLIKSDYELDSNYTIKSVKRQTTEFDDYNQHQHKGNLKRNDFNYNYYDRDIEEIINKSVGINVNQSNKSDKIRTLMKLERQESQTSKIEINNDVLFSDYDVKNQPIKIQPENSPDLDVFYLVIVIIFIFGTFTLGWLVLFSYVLFLSYQNESRGCI